MKDYYVLSMVCIINFLMFYIILSKLSLMIKKFKEYESQIIEKEDVKFKKNQESLMQLKEMFDLNKANYANENKSGSTNNWENTRKAFMPMSIKVNNE